MAASWEHGFQGLRLSDTGRDCCPAGLPTLSPHLGLPALLTTAITIAIATTATASVLTRGSVQGGEPVCMCVCVCVYLVQSWRGKGKQIFGNLSHDNNYKVVRMLPDCEEERLITGLGELMTIRNL
jgi:hypothetical protein